MTEQGFIKLHRSILGWEWYSDIKTQAVFLYLLLNANWEDYRFRGYEVPKGSLVTSYNSIAKALGISKQSARTSVSHLISTHEITLTPHAHFSIITITNWEKYQGYEEETNTHNNTHSNTQLTLNQHTPNTNKEYKEYKKERIEEYTIPPEQVQSAFNSICTNMMPCQILTKNRLDKIKALISQANTDDIKEVFARANESNYLIGKNDRGWRATFDWLIDIDNFTKVKEGNFDNRPSLDVMEKETRIAKDHFYNFDELEREVRARMLS